MSAGFRFGQGSGSARPDSPAGMHGSRAGTVRSKAAGSSFAGGGIAANGATGAPCAPSGRRKSGRRAPCSRGRTPVRCDRRTGRSARPPSSGREARYLRRGGCKSGNRFRRGRTVGPVRRGMPRPAHGRWKGRRLPGAYRRLVRRYVSGCVSRCGSRSRGSIDRVDRRYGRKGAVGSCRSGRRQAGLRMRDPAARYSAAIAVATTEAGGTAVASTGAVVAVAATGAAEAGGTTGAAEAGGAEESRQGEGSFSMIGRRGGGGFAGV